MPFVRRDGANNIVGHTKWPYVDNPESIAEDHPEFVAYLAEQTLPQPPTPRVTAPPVPVGNSIPDLRAEVALLRQAIIDAGLMDA